MSNYVLTIGPCPAEENAAQTYDPGFTEKNWQECKAFKDQLLREFGEPPEGTILYVKVTNHEFGEIREVAIKHDGTPDNAVWALAVQECAKTTWDKQAREELGL